MDHDPTPSPETTTPTPSGPPTTTPDGPPPNVGAESDSGGGTSAGAGVDQARAGRSRRRASGVADEAGAPSSDSHDSDLASTPRAGLAPAPGTVRLASPGSVVASVPLLFGFHPDNSLVILGIGNSSAGGRYIRHGVRIDLDQIRGRERAAALELAARLRDHDADIAILVAFGPHGATGAKARPDHCRKLMAAFRAQIEAAPTEERVTVVDALYTCNGRWWSYMCRNTRCCPTTGTVVPAEAPQALTTALTTRGHTVYPSREALDATLAPYPPHILERTAAATEHLDPTWYDTDAGLTAARHLMDTLLLRCGDPATAPTRREAATASTSTSTSAARIARRGLATTATVPVACASTVDSAIPRRDASPQRRSRAAATESPRSGRRGIAAAPTVADASTPSTDSVAPRGSRSSAADFPRSATRITAAAAAPAPDASSRSLAAEPSRSAHRSLTAAAAAAPTVADASASSADSVAPRRSRTVAAESPRASRQVSATATILAATSDSASSSSPRRPSRRTGIAAAESPRHTATTTAPLDAAAIPAARSSRRRSQVANPEDSASDPAIHPDAPQISDAEVAQLLIALLNWRVRDYLACAAATEDSAARLLRLCTELARRAPHPELRLAPYSLAAWAAWAIGRPSIAQCAVDRALAIDPEYKFASLIRAGLHHAIDGEGVRESAANTRRDLFGEDPVDHDPSDPDHASTPVPSQRSTEPVPTNTDLEMP